MTLESCMQISSDPQYLASNLGFSDSVCNVFLYIDVSRSVLQGVTQLSPAGYGWTRGVISLARASVYGVLPSGTETLHYSSVVYDLCFVDTHQSSGTV